MDKVLLTAYNLLYPVGAAVFSPFLAYKLASEYKYRAGLAQKLSFELPEDIPYGKRVWFHAVSVGETQAVAPVVREFKGRHPEVGVYFSTTTYTGMGVAKRELADAVDSFFYFPLDFYPVVKRVLDRVKPRAISIVETEIWPTLLFLSKQEGVPVFMVNGRLSDASFRGYYRIRSLMKNFLEGYYRLFMKSEADAVRIVLLGAPQDRVEVTGNIKYYSVYLRSTEIDVDHWRKELGKDGEFLWVCGSTHEGEEEKILEAYRILSQRCEGVKLCIAPRHPERFREVAQLIKQFGFRLGLRSDGAKLSSCDVLLLDTVGELFAVYSVADVVFVGGSLVEVGGHNPLEPLAFCKPTACGPHYFNFRDVMEELAGLVRVVGDESELVDFVERVFNGGYVLDENRVKRLFEGSLTSVERVIEGLEEVL